MVKTFILILCLSLLPAAELSAEGSGTSSLYSLINPPSAQSAAISGACTAVTGSLPLMQYNPATLITVPDFTLSATFQEGYSDDFYATLIFGKNFDDSAVGGGIKYYDTGIISLYDLYGHQVSKTGQKDMIFFLGSAQNFGFMAAGMNLKVYFSEIFGESAFGFAADAGGLYDVTENITVGVSVQNIGTPVKYLNEKEPLPLALRGGISYRGSLDWAGYVLSFDLPYYVNENAVFIKTGAEFILNDLMTFRAGGRIAAGSRNRDDGMLSVGWSFGSSRLRLDYSVRIAGRLNTPQFVTTEFKF